MEIIDFINELNANGKLEYSDYSQLHDLASDLKAENGELKARIEKAVELPCKPLSNVWFISRNHLNCGLLIGAQAGFVDGLSFNDIINFRIQCGLKTYRANDIFLTRKEAEARLKELKEGNL